MPTLKLHILWCLFVKVFAIFNSGYVYVLYDFLAMSSEESSSD